MANGVTTVTGMVFFSTVPDVEAGTSLGTSRADSADRAQSAAVGSIIGKTTFTIDITPLTSAFGIVEYCVFKAHRQFTVPVLGTDPLPTNAEIQTNGLQGMMRMQMPGWVVKFGQIPISPEVPQSRTISVDWNKFKFGKVRDGDYFGIVIYNRTSATVTTGVQARYYEYK